MWFNYLAVSGLAWCGYRLIGDGSEKSRKWPGRRLKLAILETEIWLKTRPWLLINTHQWHVCVGTEYVQYCTVTNVLFSLLIVTSLVTERRRSLALGHRVHVALVATPELNGQVGPNRGCSSAQVAPMEEWQWPSNCGSSSSYRAPRPSPVCSW